jgi:hypothetical protein
VIAVVGWGASIVGLGLAVLGAGWLLDPEHALWLAAACLACAGAADSVSSVFRSTILQSATPTTCAAGCRGLHRRGGGGPRVGDVVAGSLATVWGEGVAIVAGGAACVLAGLALTHSQRGFLAYDARRPTP